MPVTASQNIQSHLLTPTIASTHIRSLIIYNAHTKTNAQQPVHTYYLNQSPQMIYIIYEYNLFNIGCEKVSPLFLGQEEV